MLGIDAKIGNAAVVVLVGCCQMIFIWRCIIYLNTNFLSFIIFQQERILPFDRLKSAQCPIGNAGKPLSTAVVLKKVFHNKLTKTRELPQSIDKHQIYSLDIERCTPES